MLPLYWNLTILFICQLISVGCSIVVFTLGGIAGAILAPTPALATLPLSAVVIGTACTTVPAAAFMQRVGRRTGFATAAFGAALAALLAAYALQSSSFLLFAVSTFMIGANQAFVQQYRFAAAESVAVDSASKAISFVLLGAIGGALLGPELAEWSGDATASAYIGSMLTLAVLYGVVAVLLFGLRSTPADDRASSGGMSRPLAEIARQPAYIVAVMAGMVGYGLMNLLMTAAPLSMHRVDGHSLDEAAGVIGSHVVAMYAPSLFSGYLMERVGLVRMMSAGAFMMLAALGLGLMGRDVAHYWYSMVVLGIGWNFLYIGGTTLLVRTCDGPERFRAQALNEFSVFGASALASLLSGTLIHYFGWNTLLEVSAPLVLVMLLALFWIRSDPLAVS